MNKKPHYWDSLIGCFFALLATAHPYFLQQKINMLELEFYLPGIDAISRGQIPYRDFFHLRGPLELYIPALVMSIFGKNIAVLSSYFYAGTVLTLWIYILIAQQLLKTRFIFYLCVPVFVAKTFPRVVFSYWGGMRYALGALAILAAVYFFKTRNKRWMGLAGFVSAAAFLTSVEVGTCAIVGILAALHYAYRYGEGDKKFILPSLRDYGLGLALVFVPYGLYLAATQSLAPFIDAHWTVLTQMPKAFIIVMDTSFKYLSPVLAYIFFLAIVVVRMRQKASIEAAWMALAGYGLIMYAAAFRNITTASFEMALQPEKIVLFFILEEIYLWAQARKMAARSPANRQIVWAVNAWILILVVSSLGGAWHHLDHRYFMFKYPRYVLTGQDPESLKPLYNIPAKPLNLSRAHGLTVPADQAEELEGLTRFMERNTAPDEPVFMYPEMGAYYFLVDRQFVGRFPIANLSWMKEAWHRELVEAVERANPRYVVLAKEPAHFEKYLRVPSNKVYYEEVLSLIYKNYRPVKELNAFFIYRRKDL